MNFKIQDDFTYLEIKLKGKFYEKRQRKFKFILKAILLANYCLKIFIKRSMYIWTYGGKNKNQVIVYEKDWYRKRIVHNCRLFKF